jgi:hypothetical protein
MYSLLLIFGLAPAFEAFGFFTISLVALLSLLAKPSCAIAQHDIQSLGERELRRKVRASCRVRQRHCQQEDRGKLSHHST